MKARARGIYLLSVLLATLVLVMLVVALLKLVPSAMDNAEQVGDREKALRAAEAGVRYAVARLQENYAWRGDGNGVIVDLPGSMQVREQDGNVVGILTAPDGSVSQFRIRFNYQDGDPGNDNLPDSSLEIAHPYVSVNNLTNFVSSVPVPRSNGGPDWRVPDPPGSMSVYSCPTAQTVLIAEGLAGGSLRGTTTSAPEPPPGGGPVSRRYVEAHYRRSSPEAAGDVLAAGGSVTLTPLDGPVVLETAGSTAPKARAKGDLALDSPLDPNLVTTSKLGAEYTYGGTDIGVAAGKGVTSSVNSDPDLLRLEWSDLVFPDNNPTSSNAVQLKAGTYLFNSGSNQLEWYNSDYGDWIDGIPPAPPDAVVAGDFMNMRTDSVSGTPVSFDSGSGKLMFADDVNVVPQSGADSVAFVSDDPEGRPLTLGFSGPSSGNHSFYSPGDILIQGSLLGKGTSLIAGEAINVTHGGVDLSIEPDAETGVNMYAKSNVLIATNVTSAGYSKGGFGSGKGASKYLDIQLTGIIYTWGDFEVYAGDPAAGKSGKLLVTGSLVAYGNDPSLGDPGGALDGNVIATAENIRLKYDASYIDPVIGSGAGILERVSWATY